MNTVGINTLVYMDELQSGAAQSQLIGDIASFDVHLAEVRYEYITDEQERMAIRDAARAYDMTLYLSVPESLVLLEHGEHIVNPRFEQFLHEALQMGVSQLKFNQGALPTTPHELIVSIDRQARDFGLHLTIENDQTADNGTFACTEATLRQLREAGSDIGYTFDAGNWYWQHGDPHQAFTALHNNITVFHLKNIAGSAAAGDLHTVLLDEGMIHWKDMLRSLAAHIPVFLEYPIAHDDIASELSKVQAVCGKGE